MCSHKGIPVVTAFMLQMPCFPAMLFSWLSTSHLIWVESSSFQSDVVIILPICHWFKYSHANLAEPLAICPCQNKQSWSQKSQMVWGQGCLNLDWFGLWLVPFAPARASVCAWPVFLLLAFIEVLALVWGLLHLIQLLSLIENFLLKEFLSSFPGCSTGLIEVKLLCAVTCALVCGVSHGIIADICK